MASLNDGLTAEPRARRQARRFVQHILLGFFALREMFFTSLDNHMTGRARAVAATRVFKRHLMAEEHIQNRPRLSIILKRGVGWIEFDEPFRITGLEEHP